MTYQFIKVEVEDRITRITINRPEVLNAIHPPTSAEIGRALDEFESDETTWAAILTGAGDKAFSAGNDLKVTASGEIFSELSWKGGFGGITDRHDMVKPIIAAVNGLAVGGGFEMALACDFLIASENATFAFPEPRVGLAAWAGGLHRLPRAIPYKYAMGMILSGKRIDAQEAHRIGLVMEVVPQEKLMDSAMAWASEILQGAPISVRLSKQAASMYCHLPLEEAMHQKPPLWDAFVNSEDIKEGPKAFAEKRKPHWKGK